MTLICYTLETKSPAITFMLRTIRIYGALSHIQLVCQFSIHLQLFSILYCTGYIKASYWSTMPEQPNLMKKSPLNLSNGSKLALLSTSSLQALCSPTRSSSLHLVKTINYLPITKSSKLLMIKDSSLVNILQGWIRFLRVLFTSPSSYWLLSLLSPRIPSLVFWSILWDAFGSLCHAASSRKRRKWRVTIFTRNSTPCL